MIQFKRLTADAVLPRRQTEGAAGYDLALSHDLEIAQGVLTVAGTGIAVSIPFGYVGLLTIRSSVGKKGIIIPNAPGIIDSDYRGEIKILLYKLESYYMSGYEKFEAGERIAQLVVVKNFIGFATEVDELSPTDRGIGGFGSTGVK